MAQITTTMPAGVPGRDNAVNPGDLIEQALTGNGIGTWDWDLASGKATYSPLNNTMLGYDPGELGETFAEQAAKIHPDDARAMQAKVDQHLRGETESYRPSSACCARTAPTRGSSPAAWSSSTGRSGSPGE